MTNVIQVFAVTVNSLARPTMTATLANGTLKITFSGTPGASYHIQSSSDLKNWTTIATVTANAVTGAAEYQRRRIQPRRALLPGCGPISHAWFDAGYRKPPVG